MSDQQIEQEIQAKGLTAPRVTPTRINDVIVSEHYFTAADGVTGATNGKIGYGSDHALSLLTFCVLTLENGFTVTGESACASPENFDAEIGRKIARDNAVNKVWMLEGYLLKQRLHEEKSVSVQLSVNASQSAFSHVDRMRQEHCELFNGLCATYQNLMKRQLVAMREYADMLEARLAAVEEFRAA
ncbi:Gp49 family protein [Aeromonas veronii]